MSYNDPKEELDNWEKQLPHNRDRRNLSPQAEGLLEKEEKRKPYEDDRR